MAREMDKFQLDIMGLSEVRWTIPGKMTLSPGKTLLFSGPQNEEDHHRNGFGLLLIKQAHKCLLEWKHINDRILRARFHSKFKEVSILIHCYAPTNQANEDVRKSSNPRYKPLLTMFPSETLHG